MTDERKKTKERREKGKDKADLSPGDYVSECAVGVGLGVKYLLCFALIQEGIFSA